MSRIVKIVVFKSFFARRLRVHQGNGKFFRAKHDKTEFQKLLSKTKERQDSESNPMRTSASNG